MMYRSSPLFERALLLFGFLLTSFIAVSGQSLWIDEANSALKAVQPTFSLFWERNLQIAGSDLQMPLYMVLLWCWEKLVGGGEYALRSLNILFFAVANLVVYSCWRVSRPWRLAFMGMMFCSPMLWSYLDEARPYLMQFSGALCVHVSLMNMTQTERMKPSDLSLAGIGMLLICGSSLTGVIFAFWWGLAFLVLVLTKASRRRSLWTFSNVMIGLCIALALLALGVFYAWTLSGGTRASAIASTSLTTLAFCLYELLGFSGWGPGRLALRESGILALKGHVPQLALVAMSALLFWGVGLRSVLQKTKMKSCVQGRERISQTSKLTTWAESQNGVPLVVLATLAGTACMTLVGVVSGMRILGRHLMPLMPSLLLLMSVVLLEIWKKENRRFRIVGACFCLSLVISCLLLRFSVRHAKDDYRAAASIARGAVAEGKMVWWCADPAGGEYYKVPLGYYEPMPESRGKGCAVVRVGGKTAETSRVSIPELILLSKHDVYDPSGAIRHTASTYGLAVVKRFPAFEVYASFFDGGERAK